MFRVFVKGLLESETQIFLSYNPQILLSALILCINKRRRFMKTNKKWVESLFYQQLDLIKEHATNLKEFPNDIEHVHQFRVRIRHLRSLLNFFKPEISKKWITKTNKYLRECAAVFSKTREMDVIVEYFNEVESVHNSDNQLGTYIRNQANQTRNQVIAAFDSLLFVDHINQLFESIPFKEKKNIKKKKLEKRLVSFAKEIVKNKKAIDFQDYTTLHEYRKDVKKLRYVLASTKPIENHAILELEPIKNLSEELGVLTDVHFIRNTLATFDGIDENQTRDFLSFLHQKEQKAFQTCIDLLSEKETKL